MMIASEIGDIARFSTPGKLVSWAGLCPVHSQYIIWKLSLHGKDERWRQKDKIRWILIEAANTASRTDERLRKFYLRLVKRHSHHIATTHVANKMCTIIWHMLSHKKLYNERKQHLLDTKLKRIQRL
jgi:transposase